MPTGTVLGSAAIEGEAQLQRGPENPVDPQAVAVIVDGEKVGWLPSYATNNFSLPVGVSAPARYQVHVLRERKLLAEAHRSWTGRPTP